ncbi:DUF6342 family protein [Kitasatospora sp. NPDC096204]|uniref:DUF6342 family protein n=1 Tax=Kitasatospora sp. NPDC096204 TaxID=3364094 RepID=UPI0038016BEF
MPAGYPTVRCRSDKFYFTTHHGDAKVVVAVLDSSGNLYLAGDLTEGQYRINLGYQAAARFPRPRGPRTLRSARTSAVAVRRSPARPPSGGAGRRLTAPASAGRPSPPRRPPGAG